LKTPVNEETIKSLSEQFSYLVVDGVLASQFISGAKESLKVLNKNSIPAYIVSGTPDNEIKLIIKKKGLNKYFKEVHGSPRKKWEICQEIINRENYNPQNCLFVGDAMSDYNAARKNAICFLGIVENGKASPFPDGTIVSSVVTLKCSGLPR